MTLKAVPFTGTVLVLVDFLNDISHFGFRQRCDARVGSVEPGGTRSQPELDTVELKPPGTKLINSKRLLFKFLLSFFTNSGPFNVFVLVW